MQSFWIEPIFALIIGYFLGAIPFGLLLTKLTGGGDIREIGSGNIGATNVLRTGKKWLAALTLLLDIAKGAAAVIITGHVLPGCEAFAAMGAFLGHLYPIWLRFKGGKGVATLLGVVLALSWQAGLVFALVWLVALLVLRYSSVSGMLAAISIPVSAAILALSELVPMFIAFALLVLWRHRENIERLMSGEEPKVGQSKQ